MRIQKGKSLDLKDKGNEKLRKPYETKKKKKRRSLGLLLPKLRSASLDYVDSSDASRYKGTREICEAIMDPIAVTALLYKLNIVKLQLYIVSSLTYCIA